jgi:branched-subunit amino acid transport protein
VTWTLVVLLALGAYGFKALGLLVIGDRALPPVVDRCLALIPPAMLAALIVANTFSSGQDLVLDARAVGVGAAALMVWRRAPVIVVIVGAAAVTALVRAL